MGLGSRGLAVHSPLVGLPEMRFLDSLSVVPKRALKQVEGPTTPCKYMLLHECLS